MERIIVVINGPDADKALGELISNAEYDKLDVVIWIDDNPDQTVIEHATLSYSPEEVH